ncbi:MAG: DNA polymerase III subunit delta [Parcubacteria group bacterium]|nr:DNA polymerase III subunit delta [Parcubacteria group bacterium]
MVIFLHGVDTFHSRQRLHEIIAKFRRDVDPQGYNISVLQGADTSCQAVISALSSAPFLARKRMVVLEKYSDLSLKAEETESLAAAASAVMDSDTVLVVWEEALEKKMMKDPVVSILAKSKFVMDFPALDQPAVASWMRERLQAEGVQLAPDAWTYVAIAVDDNDWLASSEVNKLVAFAQARGLTRLDAGSVRQLVASGVRDNVFALVDAVTDKRPAEALSRLRDQLKAGSHELELVSLLFRQYRVLQQIHDGLAEGLPPDSIARVYKINPYVVKKLLPKCRHLDTAAIRKGYALLTGLDREIKRSGLDASLLLSRTIARLAV